MNKWSNFKTVQVPASTTGMARPRFSLTSDILSFRHCSYQYGHFGHDGFVPAQAAQIFFGTVIHQVLDHCHRHYWGFYPGIPKGTLPQDPDIEGYFNEVESALKSHGVRAANAAVRERALVVLKAFNAVEGAALYPCIHDTEFRLESDRSQYVLRGVVDVLVNDTEDPNSPEKREIWDYKGAHNPGRSHPDMQDYEWQMCVYAELYKAKSGVYPARAVLYFLNELTPADVVAKRRPKNAMHIVEFTPQKVQAALQAFDATALNIMTCQVNKQWPIPDTEVPKGTCDICDLRWRCSKVEGKYKLRLPIEPA